MRWLALDLWDCPKEFAIGAASSYGSIYCDDTDNGIGCHALQHDFDTVNCLYELLCRSTCTSKISSSEDNQALTTDIVHSDRRFGIEHSGMHKPIHTSVQYGFDRTEDLIGAFQGTHKGD